MAGWSGLGRRRGDDGLIDLTSFAKFAGIAVPVKATPALWEELSKNRASGLDEVLDTVKSELRDGAAYLPGGRRERLLSSGVRMHVAWDAEDRPEVRLSQPMERLIRGPARPEQPARPSEGSSREFVQALRRVVDHYSREELHRFLRAPTGDHVFASLLVLDRHLGGDLKSRAIEAARGRAVEPPPADEPIRRGPKP